MHSYEQCPLCFNHETQLFHRAINSERNYLLCPTCDLVFVPKSFHLCPEEEKQIYDLHNNDPNDAGYRRFLSKLSTPMITKLRLRTTPQKGLDFGSGPGPTLSIMFEEQGFVCSNFDKFYANDPDTLSNTYNFISSTEVIEHLDQPRQVFDRLAQMLAPQGVLGLMTKLRPEPNMFASWHYIKDPTHITFYSRNTFEYLADLYNTSLVIIEPDVIIMELNN